MGLWRKYSEAGPSMYQNQFKTSNKNKESLLWDQEVKTNRATPNNKLSAIIHDKEKEKVCYQKRQFQEIHV